MRGMFSTVAAISAAAWATVAPAAFITASVTFFGTVTSSTIADVGVGDRFRADLTFSFDPAGDSCRYGYDPCGWGGDGSALFSVAPAAVAGLSHYEYFRTPLLDGSLPRLFSFVSSNGIVAGQGNERTGSGFYRDARGSLTLTAINVPEPASWSLLIAGFAMVGATLRRRKVSVGFA